MGPAGTEPGGDAHDCIMVESSKGTHRIQGCGATFVSPTAGSPQIDGRIRQPTVLRPDLRDVTGPRQVGTEKRPSGRTKKLDQRIEKYRGVTHNVLDKMPHTRVGKIALSRRATCVDLEGDFAHAVKSRDRTACALRLRSFVRGVGIGAQAQCPPYDHAFFATGTGMPAILRLTEPRWTRLVKNNVFQSSPPKPRLVVAGCPWTMRPSFLPLASRI